MPCAPARRRMRFLLPILMLAGCLEHAELRTQQCAQRCIDRHGWMPPRGSYGSWATGDYCHCRLWTGKHVNEGKLTSNRWPE